ncbi:hypothetical protein CFB52_027180 [Burkholderia sp. AU18528]|uniref:hypothetical protein n=1 Tax=Burkholderia sp. AU18528 TaxID=2015350 RepID=UPI000C06A65D|nr:hypothetical protein [Burkholderia sp. AU18528]PHP85808.1 hypothetical protein CFB52_027180 [Burkholderia sp. AU18528]
MDTTTLASIPEQFADTRLHLKRMVFAGELLIAPFFAERLGISMEQLARLEDSGNVFSVHVDGTPYYPAFFAAPDYNHRRLRKICRLIRPAQAVVRLKYLTTRWGALNDRTPLEAMQTDDGFLRLLAIAKYWAAQWSLTTVEIRADASPESSDFATAAACIATVEVSSEESVWHRAAEALKYRGNIQTEGPFPWLGSVTVTVMKRAGGNSEPLREVELKVRVVNGMAYARVVSSSVELSRLRPVPVDAADDIVQIVRKVLGAVESMT